MRNNFHAFDMNIFLLLQANSKLGYQYHLIQRHTRQIKFSKYR